MEGDRQHPEERQQPPAPPDWPYAPEPSRGAEPPRQAEPAGPEPAQQAPSPWGEQQSPTPQWDEPAASASRDRSAQSPWAGQDTPWGEPADQPPHGQWDDHGHTAAGEDQPRAPWDEPATPLRDGAAPDRWEVPAPRQDDAYHQPAPEPPRSEQPPAESAAAEPLKTDAAARLDQPTSADEAASLPAPYEPPPMPTDGPVWDGVPDTPAEPAGTPSPGTDTGQSAGGDLGGYDSDELPPDPWATGGGTTGAAANQGDAPGPAPSGQEWSTWAETPSPAPDQAPPHDAPATSPWGEEPARDREPGDASPFPVDGDAHRRFEDDAAGGPDQRRDAASEAAAPEPAPDPSVVGRAQVPGLVSPPPGAPADNWGAAPAAEERELSSAEPQQPSPGGFALPDVEPVDRYTARSAPPSTFGVPDQDPVDRYAPPEPTQSEPPADPAPPAEGDAGSPWAAFASAWDRSDQDGAPAAEPPGSYRDGAAEQPAGREGQYPRSATEGQYVPPAGDQYGSSPAAAAPQQQPEEAPPAAWPPAPEPWAGDELVSPQAQSARGVASVPVANRLSSEELAELIAANGGELPGPSPDERGGEPMGGGGPSWAFQPGSPANQGPQPWDSPDRSAPDRGTPDQGAPDRGWASDRGEPRPAERDEWSRESAPGAGADERAWASDPGVGGGPPAGSWQGAADGAGPYDAPGTGTGGQGGYGQQPPPYQSAPPGRHPDAPPAEQPWDRPGSGGSEAYPWAPHNEPPGGHPDPGAAPGRPGDPYQTGGPGREQSMAPRSAYDQPGRDQPTYDPNQGQPAYDQPRRDQPAYDPNQGQPWHAAPGEDLPSRRPGGQEPPAEPVRAEPGFRQDRDYPNGPQRGPGQYSAPPLQNAEPEPGSWWERSAARGGEAFGGRSEGSGGSGSGGGGPGREPPWPLENPAGSTADDNHAQSFPQRVDDTLHPSSRFAEQLRGVQRTTEGQHRPADGPPEPGSAGRSPDDVQFPTDPPPRQWTDTDRGVPADGTTTQFDRVPPRQEPRYADLNPMETTNSLTGRILGPRNSPRTDTTAEREGSRTGLTVFMLIAAVVVLILAGVVFWLVLT